MGLSKVNFKPNLHIFLYLETEVMTASNFFFPRNIPIFWHIFLKS
jgi:hypothetical protein